MYFQNIITDLKLSSEDANNLNKFINDTLETAYFHFKQDFRHQLENHTYIFGIYDFVITDSDFNGYLIDLYVMFKKYNVNKKLYINQDKLMYEISSEVSSYLKNIIMLDFNYITCNINNIEKDVFDVNMFNHPNGYVDNEVLKPL